MLYSHYAFVRHVILILTEKEGAAPGDAGLNPTEWEKSHLWTERILALMI